MMHKMKSGLRFLAMVYDSFLWRLRHKNLHSAWVFLRVRFVNFYIAQRNKYARSGRSACPCCGWEGHAFYAMDATKFWLHGVFCPQCGSHERQRMLHLYIHRHDPTILDMHGRVLHIAPEQDIEKIINKNLNLSYFAADIEPGRLRAYPGRSFETDIQRLSLDENCVDLIFCLHVLEHVRQDLVAIGELERVLSPSGIAYIMVPFDMTLKKTVEWAVPDPDIYYHIWAYALPDFKERLNCFDYEEIKPETFLTPDERRKYSIPDKEVIYRCLKKQCASK